MLKEVLKLIIVYSFSCVLCIGFYKPTYELSLDESLLLFLGRFSFKQYIKGKKAKYGIQFFELATAGDFVLNISMYSGKTNELLERGSFLFQGARDTKLSSAYETIFAGRLWALPGQSLQLGDIIWKIITFENT